MAAEQEQVPSTPLAVAKPHVDVTGTGADDTVFSPGVDQLPGGVRSRSLVCAKSRKT
jgi:hypothetical protein